MGESKMVIGEFDLKVPVMTEQLSPGDGKSCDLLRACASKCIGLKELTHDAQSPSNTGETPRLLGSLITNATAVRQLEGWAGLCFPKFWKTTLTNEVFLEMLTRKRTSRTIFSGFLMLLGFWCILAGCTASRSHLLTRAHQPRK